MEIDIRLDGIKARTVQQQGTEVRPHPHKTPLNRFLIKQLRFWASLSTTSNEHARCPSPRYSSRPGRNPKPSGIAKMEPYTNAIATAANLRVFIF